MKEGRQCLPSKGHPQGKSPAPLMFSDVDEFNTLDHIRLDVEIARQGARRRATRRDRGQTSRDTNQQNTHIRLHFPASDRRAQWSAHQDEQPHPDKCADRSYCRRKTP